MQRGILDTSVIIAILISRGIPHVILTESFIENNIQLCVSDKLLEEYFDVLNRLKFTKYPDFVLNTALFLVEIQKIAMRFEPKIKLNLISNIDDNMILERPAASRGCELRNRLFSAKVGFYCETET
jgi:putative PIN family toxin of toxin-antitoxin system